MQTEPANNTTSRKKPAKAAKEQNDQTVTEARNPIVHEKRVSLRCERTFELAAWIGYGLYRAPAKKPVMICVGGEPRKKGESE